MLEEESIVFYTLLESSLEMDGDEYRIYASISAYPHMKKEDGKALMAKFSKLGKKNNKPKIPTQEEVKRDRERLKKLLKGRSLIR